MQSWVKIYWELGSPAGLGPAGKGPAGIGPEEKPTSPLISLFTKNIK